MNLAIRLPDLTLAEPATLFQVAVHGLTLAAEVSTKPERGPPGARGAQGPRGLDGFDGKDGENGEDGTPGSRGAQGPRGERGSKGEPGGTGWTPILAVQNIGSRSLLRVVQWIGGTGDQPAIGYMGADGIVPDPADATDIRGDKGPQGKKGDLGDIGPPGATVVSGGGSDVNPYLSIMLE